MMRAIKKSIFFLNEGAWRVDVDKMSMGRRLYVNGVRLFTTTINGFLKNYCGLHAAGLTYFSLMSLVPMLCLLMVCAKLCGAGDFARNELNGYFDRMIANLEQGAAVEQAVSQVPAGQVAPQTPADQEKEEKRLAQRAVAKQLREFVNPLFDKIDKFDVSTFGWVGFAVLMWTVISTLGQVEVSMNEIWSVKKARSLPKRCGLYLFTAGVVPLLTAAALSLPIFRLVKKILDSTMGASSYTKWLGDALVAVLDSRLFGFGVTLFFATLVFAFLLSLFPNCHVRPRAAVEGGGITALFFGGWVKLCTAAQVGIGKSSAFYGSFATPVILLAWIYMSWQIVLIGANLTYAFQCVHTRSRDGGLLPA